MKEMSKVEQIQNTLGFNIHQSFPNFHLAIVIPISYVNGIIKDGVILITRQINLKQ